MADSPEKKKYEPLGEHLATLQPATTELILSFAEVEKIIGDALPSSAFKHREWWANQKGGSRAPHWRAAGFAVKYANLRRKTVRFQRLEAPRGAPLAPSLQEIAAAVNARAKGRPIGELPEWRRKHKGVGRPRAMVFPSTVKPGAEWIAHNGARGHGEMQFNLGFDCDDGTNMFRHGIAFSLETSRTFTDVEPLVRKIGRFNEYLRIYPDAFEGFSMWVWDERPSTPRDCARSETRPVSPIAAKLAHKGYFIFIGRLQPVNAIDVELILDDLDRLVPVYEFVEGESAFPARIAASEQQGFEWPANDESAGATHASYDRTAKTVNMDLRHTLIRDALLAHLKKIHGTENARREVRTGNGTLIDVAVRVANRCTFYEIKTYSSAQACIREALGQLLEYSFWPGSHEAERLVIIGEAALDAPAKSYLDSLRKKFDLPVEYRQFEMVRGCLL